MQTVIKRLKDRKEVSMMRLMCLSLLLLVTVTNLVLTEVQVDPKMDEMLEEIDEDMLNQFDLGLHVPSALDYDHHTYPDNRWWGLKRSEAASVSPFHRDMRRLALGHALRVRRDRNRAMSHALRIRSDNVGKSNGGNGNMGSNTLARQHALRL